MSGSGKTLKGIEMSRKEGEQLEYFAEDFMAVIREGDKMVALGNCEAYDCENHLA